MGFKYQKDVKYLMLAKELAISAAGSTIDEVTDLVDGTLALTNQFNVTLNAVALTSTSQYIKFMIRNGDKLIQTPVFQPKQATRCHRRYYGAPDNQVSYIGYNTSGNSIEVNDDTIYTVKILVESHDRVGGSFPLWKQGNYKSDSTATQTEIAKGLHESLYFNFKREPHVDVHFGRTYSGAQTLINPGAGNYAHWTVNKDSQYITSVGGAHGISTVGTIISLAGLAFVVTEITSTTVLKIDIPWEYPSGTCIAGDVTVTPTVTVANGSTTATLSANHGITVGTVAYIGIAENGATAATAKFYSCITAATTGLVLDVPFVGTGGAGCVIAGGTCATGGNWGIRCGAMNRDFVVGKKNYEKVRFNVTIDNVNTVITNDRAAAEGTGVYQQIAELEWFCQMNEGGRYPLDHLQNQFRAVVSATGKYDMLTIDYINADDLGGVGTTTQSRGQIVIAAADETGGTHACIASVVTALANVITTTT